MELFDVTARVYVMDPEVGNGISSASDFKCIVSAENTSSAVQMAEDNIMESYSGDVKVQGLEVHPWKESEE